LCFAEENLFVNNCFEKTRKEFARRVKRQLAESSRKNTTPMARTKQTARRHGFKINKYTV
jgi:hypothetical protein